VTEGNPLRGVPFLPGVPFLRDTPLPASPRRRTSASRGWWCECSANPSASGRPPAARRAPLESVRPPSQSIRCLGSEDEPSVLGDFDHHGAGNHVDVPDRVRGSPAGSPPRRACNGRAGGGAALGRRGFALLSPRWLRRSRAAPARPRPLALGRSRARPQGVSSTERPGCGGPLARLHVFGATSLSSTKSRSDRPNGVTPTTT